MKADLHGADLRGANLLDVNLRGSDLRWAILRDANLRWANLHDADLRWANLCGANLHDADLYGADLYGADLRWANLRGADLRDANLNDAYLYGADLYGADLRGANLYGADLRGAKNLIYPLSCPEIGSFIGFKKAHDGIVTLKITEDAKRSSATTRKCRCNKAEVIQIEGFDGKQLTQTCSAYDKSFIYRVGDVVEVDDFCEDRWDECSTGIHFFITKEEAVNF
ncbi:MAG: pentapeptide repeat-containing protein [Lachnospiraceae bacterium]|nr:pentapeptide repeat-containing protein [Lachnospiraceae bacterium]